MNTVTTDIQNAVANLRPLDSTTFTVHYVNEHGVPVKRTMRVDAEEVDGAALQRQAAGTTDLRAAA